MGPLRPTAGLLILLLFSQSGCVLMEGAKVFTAPVGAVASMVGAGSKAATSASGAVGSTAGSAAMGTGRVAVSGINMASRVSVSSARATGSVGGTTVTTSGSIAGSSVRGGGTVARSAIGSGTRVSATSMRAVGSLSAATINNLARMSKAGMITFVDSSNGKVMRVPWRAGLNVYGGGALANIQTAKRAVAIVRQGRLIYQTLKALADTRALPLKPGDVLRLADYG